jgi:hypothetical protein
MNTAAFHKTMDALKDRYTDKSGQVNRNLYCAALEVAIWHICLYAPGAQSSLDIFVDSLIKSDAVYDGTPAEKTAK